MKSSPDKKVPPGTILNMGWVQASKEVRLLAIIFQISLQRADPHLGSAQYILFLLHSQWMDIWDLEHAYFYRNSLNHWYLFVKNKHRKSICKHSRHQWGLVELDLLQCPALYRSGAFCLEDLYCLHMFSHLFLNMESLRGWLVWSDPLASESDITAVNLVDNWESFNTIFHVTGQATNSTNKKDCHHIPDKPLLHSKLWTLSHLILLQNNIASFNCWLLWLWLLMCFFTKKYIKWSCTWQSTVSWIWWATTNMHEVRPWVNDRHSYFPSRKGATDLSLAPVI